MLTQVLKNTPNVKMKQQADTKIAEIHANELRITNIYTPTGHMSIQQYKNIENNLC